MLAAMRAFLLLLLLPFAGCQKSADLVACGDELVRMERDPGGALAAFHYVRDCGATTDYATTIAIGPADRGLEGATTVFVADSDHGAAEAAGRGIWLEMRWTAPHRLSVAYAEKARVFKRVEKVDGAQVLYRATGPMQPPMVD